MGSAFRQALRSMESGKKSTTTVIVDWSRGPPGKESEANWESFADLESRRPRGFSPRGPSVNELGQTTSSGSYSSNYLGIHGGKLR